MQNLSTGQRILSSNGGVIDNKIDSGNPQVSAPSGPGPTTGSSGSTQVFLENPGGGYMGPGKGSAKVLNSDGQMPVTPS